MEPDDVAELVRSKMQQLLGGEGETEVSDALVDLVAARSEGNPFYVEELISFIVSQGIDAGRSRGDRDDPTYRTASIAWS